MWGVTNPLVKRGSEAVERKLKARQHPRPTLIVLLTWIRTPSFVLPQLLNQLGSALFIYLLGSGSADITLVVPAANAWSLAANAAVYALVMGEQYNAALLAVGLALVGAGVILCGTA